MKDTGAVTPAFLQGGGEMGERMRALDWSATPLGPPEGWPQALQTIVGVMLSAGQPMFATWGPERTILYNDRYAPLLGQRHPSALGRPMEEVWADIWLDLVPLFAAVDAGGGVHMDDIQLTMHRHGYPEETHFAFSYTPLRDDTGRVAGMFCPCTETTEQVMAQRRNLAEREKLHRLFELAPGFMAMLQGPEHRFELVNPAYQRLIGHREVLGRTVAEALPETVAQGYVELLDNVYRTGEAFTSLGARLTLQAEPGGPVTERFLDFVYQPVTDADGQVSSIFVEGSDVTERVVAEQARRESDEDYRYATELNPQVTWTAGPDGQLNRVSQRWREWTGTSGLGDSWAEGLHPDDRQRTFEVWGRSVATGEPYDVEHRVNFLDKGFRWARSRAFARRDEAGAVVRWYGTTEDIHEEKSAQDALAESEGRFRAIADSIDVMIWSTLPDGAHDYYNRRWYDYTGAPQGSTDGAGWAGMFHPDDQDRAWKVWEQSLASGEPYRIEYRLRHRSGQYRWVLGRALPVRDEAGGIVRWYGTCTDIHDQKTAEAQLRAILDSVPVGILMAEAPEGRVVQANRHLETLLRRPIALGAPNYAGREGYTPDGRRLEPGDWPVSRAIATGKAAEAEVRFRKGDDSLGWIRIQAAPVREAGGEVIGAVAGVTDLQEIVEAREVLSHARADLEQRVDQAMVERNRVWTLSQDLLAVAGFDGRLKAINPAWSRLLGYDEQTLLDLPFTELIHPDDHASAAAVIERLREGNVVQSFEDRLRRSDGRYVHIAWTASSEGDVFYASGRDVTREREQEEQLRQAQKMEAVGQLTGGVAHDFNNLLQIVVGNLELTQRNLPEESARLKRSVENAMTGAKRAATLTQRLLAFSRRQPLAPKPVFVNRLVAGMSELLGRSLGETIQVETVLAGGLWRVEADPNQLENAIVNLAVNARDAMPDGGKLTIETANTRLDESYAQQNVEVTPGQYVVICVSDTGVGMNKEDMARAFEPFFTTKGVGKGTGLGLSQVYGFVKQSGGHVKIYSETGETPDHHRGTTVKIYLPRYLGPGEEGDDETEAEEAPEGGLEETVLVVEDDADVRAYTVEVLRELGYRVVEAGDGAAALKLLRDAETRCDLLFTDVVLPGGMNGEQLAAEAHEARPGLKVLFTTGYARNAIVHHGRLDPGVRLITKPFTYADLAARVRDVLDEVPTARPSGGPA